MTSFWPFLGAGFYYKTFMWPRAFWEGLYEPLIRRAAGLGRLSGKDDQLPHDKAFAHCDVLVIGAGPAGLIAARAAAAAGADVILADEDFLPGGRLNAESWQIDGQPASAWAAATMRDLAARDNVRIMTRTAVVGVYDGGIYGALERVGAHRPRLADGMPMSTFWRIAAGQAIMATGAHERPLLFPGNDRPGVMQAGALRAYVNRFGVAPGRRIAVLGSGPGALATVRDCHAARIGVAALIDPVGDPGPVAGVGRVYPAAQVLGTEGRHGLTGVTVGTPAGPRRIGADCLAVAGGMVPVVHLSCHLGAKPVWDGDLGAFVPKPGAVPGLWPAGAAAGARSLVAALQSGARAAGDALAALGRTAPDFALPEADAPDAAPSPPIWRAGEGKRVWVDFQNDVTVKDIRLAQQEGFRSPEHTKRYTTLGMAPDQGKTANLNALATIAEAQGRAMADMAPTTFRPPYAPVPIAALGAHGRGKGFAPERRTPSDAACCAAGAPMIEAGLWYRPSNFPAPGETTWREACDREVRMVREAVGVADVSTLGKIEIAGAGCSAASRSGLYWHILQPEAGPRPLWPDAARGWPCDGRWHHRAAGRGPLADDHHHGGGGPGHAESGVCRPGAAAARPGCARLRHRPLGTVRRGGPPGARHAGGAGGSRYLGRCLALHGMRSGDRGGHPRAAFPHLVFGRARL
jgi:NADPH-dependent 2,4-dienoyl-CoA reductase/sulfur reductase-like enzyme